MTGTLRIRETSAGKSYYYIKINYKDPKTGKWKSTTVKTGLEVKNNKRKAEALKQKYLDDYSYLEQETKEDGKVEDNSSNKDITLCEYLDHWLADKKIELKLSTYESYTYRVAQIKKYFEPLNIKLIDVTPKVLDVFFKYSLENGKTNQKTKKREALSVRSVRSYKSILYAAFNQAMIDGILQRNPVDGVAVHGKQNRDYSEDLLFLTEEEVADLLHFLAKNYSMLVPIAFIGAYYGLRRSELLGLKWSNIDFVNKNILIKHTVVRVKTVEAADSTKTASGRRMLNLFDTAERCLLKVKSEQEENRKFYKNEYKNKEGYVFTWEDGTTYDPDYISKLFHKATKEFGRPEITLHKLRHTCASMLINKGWDVKRLQYWLGHTDVQTTLNIYAHFNKQRLNTSVNDLSEISMVSSDLFKI